MRISNRSFFWFVNDFGPKWLKFVQIGSTDSSVVKFGSWTLGVGEAVAKFVAAYRYLIFSGDFKRILE